MTALVELKARFDEEANIRWARELERAGVQIVYGFIDLKTHAKISLVHRREGSDLRSYVHFGTGNYHPITARSYTDLSYFTQDEVLCRDASRVFNYMTGYAPPEGLEKVAVAPLTLRNTLMERIEAEIAHAQTGRTGEIWAKLNSPGGWGHHRCSVSGLAGRACCIRLVPSAGSAACARACPGLSENIEVQSIVGRFLEHGRIMPPSVIGRGAAVTPQAKLFISSADWMPRNLDRRVELLVPIEQRDRARADSRPDPGCESAGSRPKLGYGGPTAPTSRTDTSGEPDPFSAHHYFMTNPSLSGRGSALKKPGSAPQLTRRSRTRSSPGVTHSPALADA